MDTPQTTDPVDVSSIPSYRRPADRRTTTVTFRIYQDQDTKLRESYDGQSSAIIRILLDMYLGGELPSVDEKFKKE